MSLLDENRSLSDGDDNASNILAPSPPVIDSSEDVWRMCDTSEANDTTGSLTNVCKQTCSSKLKRECEEKVLVCPANSNSDVGPTRLESALGGDSLSAIADEAPPHNTVYSMCVKCGKFFLPCDLSRNGAETTCKGCWGVLDGAKSDQEDQEDSKSTVVNGNSKERSCDICGKSFTRIYGLTIHKRMHSGERPFSCGVCRNSFYTVGHLNAHKRVHTQEKPFECTHCGDRFSSSSSRARHLRKHTGEKPFSCEFCDKTFHCSTNYTKHWRSHTGVKPYKCDVCGQSFRDNSGLSVHKRLHSGDKPYTCESCGKAFRTSAHLVKHRRVHSGEKPYRCEGCDRRFSDSSSRNRHRKLHKREDDS